MEGGLEKELMMEPWRDCLLQNLHLRPLILTVVVLVNDVF